MTFRSSGAFALILRYLGGASLIVALQVSSQDILADGCPTGGCRAEITGWHFGNGPKESDNLHLNASNIGALKVDWIVYSGCDGLGTQSYFVIDGGTGLANAPDKSFGQYVQHIETSDDGDTAGNSEHTSPLKNSTELLLTHPCKHTLQLWATPTIPADGSCFSPNHLAPVLSNEITIWIDSPASPSSDPVDPFPGNPKTESTCSNGPREAPTVGCPVDIANGKMYHQMVDLSIDGPLPIEFVRRYDSKYAGYPGVLGNGWQHNGMMHLQGLGTGINDALGHMSQVLVDQQMRRVTFNCKNEPLQVINGSSVSPGTCNGVWWTDNIDQLTLTQDDDQHWHITDNHGTVYDFEKANFRADGKLTAVHDRNSNSITYHYDSHGNVDTITDSLGRFMTLNYDYTNGRNRLDTLVADSRTVHYEYYGNGDLETVTFPDTSYVTYSYNGSHQMTQAVDKLSHVIEEHTYTGGLVTSTQSDGGNYKYTITRTDPAHPTVINARTIPVTTNYTIDTLRGVATDRSGGPGCSSCGDAGNETHKTYDQYLNVTRVVDGRGGCTEMTYDGNGNVLTRTEGRSLQSGSCQDTASTRTTTYGTYNSFNFPTTISVPSVFPTTTDCGTAHPNRITTLSYGSTGNLDDETVTGCNGPNTSDFFTYVTHRTYDAHGQVLSVDGPRSGTVDKTIYEYYSDTDQAVPADNRGRLKKISDPLANPTTIAEYDYFGNIKKVVDANNVETDYTYDGKDRVLEVKIVGSPDIVTQYQYDSVGRLYRLKRPNCVAVSCNYSFQYGYDTVNRVIEIDDALGNKILYAYDKEGNRTRTEFQDTSSVKQFFTNFRYDNFNRLEYAYFNEGPPDPPTSGSIFYQYAYFGDGTLKSELDPRQNLTSYDYDDLKRLTSQTQTVSSVPLTTHYEYDGLDGLKKITDPRAIETKYTNGDLGWRLKEESPDAGTTLYQSYDEAGNLLQSQDARGYTTTRTYDGLDHLLTTTYTDTSLNVTNVYGTSSSAFNVGRLASLTVGPTSSPTSVSTFAYDRRGLLTGEQKAIAGLTYSTGYAYDRSGNLLDLTYPTSDVNVRQDKITYAYDNSERVSSISSLVNGTTRAIASGFLYKPFGPRTQATFGNTLADNRAYDYRYRLGAWTLGSLLDYSHTYDDNSNLIGRTDNKTAANTRGFEYDEINRLKCAAGPWAPGTACSSSVVYTYDSNGNRLSSNETTPATSYAYGSTNNRLLSTTTNSVTTNLQYDSDGNTTSDGVHSYQYNQANRLGSVDSDATATYSYDGENRRDRKTVPGTTTLYFYDQTGRLLTELTPNSQGGVGDGVDYVYADDGPIARLDWSVNEQTVGDVLRAYKSSSNVHLDWTAYTPTTDAFVVRRKQVVNTDDKTFDGATTIAFPAGSTKVYDDPVVGNGNRYDYSVLKQTKSDTLFYYHTDHLGTPTLITDSSPALTWKAEFFPFGGLVPNTLTGSKTNNLRFPGQYFDSETGLHQNWFRDYAPKTGRYSEADPIGLAGGNNPYSYAGSNSLAAVDPAGLDVQFVVGGPHGSASYGHVALRVFGVGYDFTYDFGRYGATTGLFNTRGEGQLRVWNSFRAYMLYQNNLGRTTTGFTYSTSPEDDRAIIDFYAQETSGSSPNYTRGGLMKQYLLDEYDAANNNCTSNALEGASHGLPASLITALTASAQNRGRGLAWYERPWFFWHQTQPRISLPLDLQSAIQQTGGYYFAFTSTP